MRNAKQLVLRTGRSPIASFLTEQGFDFDTLDDCTNSAGTSTPFHQADHVTLLTRQRRATCATWSATRDFTDEPDVCSQRLETTGIWN